MTSTRKAAFQQDLARIKEAQAAVASASAPRAAHIDRLVVNPSLQIVPTAWRRLTTLLDAETQSLRPPESGEEMVLVWQSPLDGRMHTEEALTDDLIALKMVLEETDPLDAARDADIPVAIIDNAIRHAVSRGLLLAPLSRIRRPESFQCTETGERLLSAGVFTLQWHITQECDLQCLHCYDRSARRSVDLAEGLRILDQMRDFCQSHFVRGQVSFSGGNPLLHPEFTALYRAAAHLGLATAILGNPTSPQRLAELTAIQMPAYFQVSLEGLEVHNDRMRGAGHYRRTLEFLDIMGEQGVPSEVMLTLTRENMDQVLPLGEVLRGRTGSFTFNRLALFGAGAGLELPDKEDYAAFLADYLAAMRHNHVLSLKDSLFNIAMEKENLELFDGCAGYGCGAAFNFVALLPDGEVHACRKFPSPIGTINDETLSAIYHSEAAASYREGSSACRGCELRAACRGCPAVTAGCGGDPLADRDPFCFRG
jgi:selenobiotic family peptide radical SAM maturase